jgi:hypothetical protein
VSHEQRCDGVLFALLIAQCRFGASNARIVQFREIWHSPTTQRNQPSALAQENSVRLR